MIFVDYKTFFKGKKITQLGLGLLGRGVGDAAFLAECGAELIVTDRKTKEELTPSLEKLKPYTNITFVLGEHRLEDFRGRDFILKGAGVPLDSPYIAEARKNNIPIEMDASLFCRLAEGIISVGVTGTRGKTTTTMLIYELAKAQLKGQKVFLAGNIKDTATLPLLKEVSKNDIVVLELDSWQLQGFGESKLSPNISVFTNFLNDHLNYYKGDLELYFEDKANIFLHQKQNDYLVTGEKVAHLITAKHHGKLFHHPITFSAASVPADWKIKLPGEHNRENIAAAIAVAKVMGISFETIKEVVENFTGVEGRLQFVREANGVKIYNDTTATTPDATIAALHALKPTGSKERNIVLIMGGADKTLDMSSLLAEIPRAVKAVVMLPGTGTDRVRSDMAKVPAVIEEAKTLSEALSLALNRARPGDVLLFSPAFASFGLFKNEYDRGEQFLTLVNAL